MLHFATVINLYQRFLKSILYTILKPNTNDKRSKQNVKSSHLNYLKADHAAIVRKCMRKYCVQKIVPIYASQKTIK